MSRNEELLIILNREYGDECDGPWEMLREAATDSCCPGICTKCETCYEEVEPDTLTYWCEQCQENSVISCLVLAGII
jgi:hypothetical protein